MKHHDFKAIASLSGAFDGVHKEFAHLYDEMITQAAEDMIFRGVPGENYPGLMASSIAYDEVGNPGLMRSFEYPVLDALAPDRDRIRAHLKLVRSDIMKNYTVTYEQFNNGMKRLSCDAYEVPSWLSGYMTFTGFDTVSRVAEVRKHGYRLNAVGMSRYWKSPYRNARTVSEIAEIPESFLFGGTK